MAKPVVDGIEKDLQDRAKVIRLDIGNEIGQLAAQRYGVRSVPTLFVLDGQGQVNDYVVGIPNRKAVVDMVNTLLEKGND
ncbi:MAG: thioredoxin family protein [Anaerolineae bacterium]|nr:thioredoxin family protein [Anaerolineae bacterium]